MDNYNLQELFMAKIKERLNKYASRLKIRNTMKFNLLQPVEDYTNTLVYTPMWIAERMLDIIPDEVWTNQNAKLLDTCCKSGVFLDRAYWKFNDGLKKLIPDEFERAEHILRNQLYGLALTDKLANISRNVVYGVNDVTTRQGYVVGFNNKEGNIKTFKFIHRENEFNYEQIINEGTGEVYKRLLMEAFGTMEFNVIIGNPPYQEMTGGGSYTEGAKPLYNKFIEKAMLIKPQYISMIIPSRWMAGGHKSLDRFRAQLVESKHLSEIYDFDVAKDVFDGVDIVGGVQYFLIDNTKTYDKCKIVNCKKEGDKIINEYELERDLGSYTYTDQYNKTQYLIVRNNKAINIIEKVRSKENKFISDSVLIGTFGLDTTFDDSKIQTELKNIKVVKSYGKYTYTDMRNIRSNKDKVDKYKVIVGKISTEGGKFEGDKRLVITLGELLSKGEVCTQTYLVVNTFDNIEEAHNFREYLKTKFVRWLIYITLTSMHLNHKTFIFVPDIDFSKQWTDAELYKRYELSQEEISMIESTIKQLD